MSFRLSTTAAPVPPVMAARVARPSSRRLLSLAKCLSPPGIPGSAAIIVGRPGLARPSCCPATASVARLQLGQQAQDLQVQPDQGDDQAEGAVPLHVLGRTRLDAGLDE